MKLESENIVELLKRAIKAAKKAGSYIHSYDRSKLEVVHKDGNLSEASQVVTEVDLHCQELILDILKESIERFDLGLLTEELADDYSRFEKDYFWCIDPLDGTLPFIENREGYSVSIALVSKEGEAIIGVVYNPLNGDLYEAMKGNGVKKNGANYELKTKLDYLTFVSDRSFMKRPFINDVLCNLNDLALDENLNGVKVIDYGGAAMNAIWVLENSPACYFKFPKKELGGGSLWDYAAVAIIVKEAGGRAANIFDMPLDLNREGATFMNHEGICFTSFKDGNGFFTKMKYMFSSFLAKVF